MCSVSCLTRFRHGGLPLRWSELSAVEGLRPFPSALVKHILTNDFVSVCRIAGK